MLLSNVTDTTAAVAPSLVNRDIPVLGWPWKKCTAPNSIWGKRGVIWWCMWYIPIFGL